MRLTRLSSLFSVCYTLTHSVYRHTGLVVYGLYGGDWDSVGYPDIANTNRRAAAFWTEVISVFFLLVSVLQIGTTRVQRNNSYYGNMQTYRSMSYYAHISHRYCLWLHRDVQCPGSGGGLGRMLQPGSGDVGSIAWKICKYVGLCDGSFDGLLFGVGVLSIDESIGV